MSADSQTRSRSHGRNGSEPVTVSPQHVTDPTILDSVAGFISDVVPNAYNVPGDSKDQIQWARFEQLDCEEYSQDGEADNFIPSPLILVLGYSNGVQVWSIPATGEAVQLFSWKHGSVKVLKILPNPSKVGLSVMDEHSEKRPLLALCDNATPSPHFCSLSFLSLKTSEQVKLIKFQIPILDVVANRTSVAVTFAERIAVFDAFTLEDKLVITTCYLSPGITANPVSLGARWLAYAENKLIPSRRSSGGNEGEGVQSYTATVLHAAKSLGRGLREFGETVANSLTGTTPYKPTHNVPHSMGNILQKGVITVLDIECEKSISIDKTVETEAVVCHFTAHTEAVVYMCFDPSGMLLLTADKRGHDFHVFRINPHPGGPSFAAVHHLYVLHRGDTTAKVQDMSFSPDSRWVTVSTLRGTTHVFPVTPYGGPVGVRTHATPYVVNKMSRFHRSAGLTAEGRSNSPVSVFEAPINSNLPYHNPRLPPFPQPTVVNPLAQVRQPIYVQVSGNVQPRVMSGRQRLGSSSEDNIHDVLRVCARFAPPRAWISNVTTPRDVHNKPPIRPVESLFIMSCHGSLIQYDLDPRHVSNVPKERVCDDTPIELIVRAKAQWVLQRYPNAKDIPLPLSSDSLSQVYPDVTSPKMKPDHNDDKWLSQVEIVTHAGPHRRLWMGPQFTFKTYTTTAGSPGSILESKPIDVRRSKPVNMPLTGAYPVLIEAGSVGSCEPSPKLLDAYHRHFDGETGCSELQLKEDLADAMLESPGAREGGRRCVIVSVKHSSGIAKVVNPLGTVVTVHSDDSADSEPVTQEEVILENCDEALFRPVVASKAVLFAEPKNVQTKISYSSLHINTTLPWKPNENVLNKNHDNQSKSKVISRKYYVPSETAEIKTKIEKSDSLSEVDSGIEKERSESPLYYENKLGKSSQRRQNESLDFLTGSSFDKSKLICDISDTLPESFSTETVVFKPPPPLEKLDFDIPLSSCESEGLISIITPVETESIQDEDVKKPNKKDRPRLKNDKYQGLEQKDIVSSSEENNASEEKVLPKKPRKPKTKLGVRIANLTTREPADDTEKKPEDVPIDFLVSLPTKRSWSSVAASKPFSKESSPSLSGDQETEQETPPMFQFVETKESTSDVKTTKSADDPKETLSEMMSLIKIDKSSDEEKLDTTGSSQTETTESDDSSRVPIESVAMDTEEDNCQVENVKVSTVPKASKKKSKKKKR